jgi:hypothetical protein
MKNSKAIRAAMHTKNSSVCNNGIYVLLHYEYEIGKYICFILPSNFFPHAILGTTKKPDWSKVL